MVARRLFTADVDKYAFIGFGVALFPGIALNDGVVAFLQRAGKFGVFGQLTVDG